MLTKEIFIDFIHFAGQDCCSAIIFTQLVRNCILRSMENTHSVQNGVSEKKLQWTFDDYHPFLLFQQNEECSSQRNGICHFPCSRVTIMACVLLLLQLHVRRYIYNNLYICKYKYVLLECWIYRPYVFQLFTIFDFLTFLCCQFHTCALFCIDDCRAIVQKWKNKRRLSACAAWQICQCTTSCETL